MTFEEKILRNDISGNYYTEHDIKQHLLGGVYYYESYEEFCRMWVSCLGEPEEAPDAWEALGRAVVDGKEYRYDTAL